VVANLLSATVDAESPSGFRACSVGSLCRPITREPVLPRSTRSQLASCRVLQQGSPPRRVAEIYAWELPTPGSAPPWSQRASALTAGLTADQVRWTWEPVNSGTRAFAFGVRIREVVLGAGAVVDKIGGS
jgi:hypothetical protein